MSVLELSGLTLEEYKSLREESAQARQSQQTILQWSLGAFAVLFGAGLAFSRTDDPIDFSVFSIVYGLALPGFVFASALTWWGELIRMERAGHFLRGKEIATWPSQVRGNAGEDLVRSEFPSWEMFIAHLGSDVRSRKQLVGYVGALSIYAGALVFSFLTFSTRWNAHQFEKIWVMTMGNAWALAVPIIFMGVFLLLGRDLMKLGKKAAGFEIKQHRDASDSER